MAIPGTADSLAWWVDKAMFTPAVTLVYSVIGERLPVAFKEDRAKFSGRDFDPAAIRAALPYQLDQLRGHLDLLERMLLNGRTFLRGSAAGLVDLAAYHFVWFIQQNVGTRAKPLDEFPKVLAWSERIAAIGHGAPSDMTAKDALAIANSAQPRTETARDEGDPTGLKPGQMVVVTPDDTGRDPVSGELIASDSQEIVIRRTHAQVGDGAVHFPRIGFVVAVR
jgi:hypothetical protein